jgi:surface antigen
MCVRRVALLLCLPLGVTGLLSGCAYSSPQQQEASACQVIGPKAMIGALGGSAGGAAIGAAAGGGRGAAIGAGIGLLAGAIGGHVADQQDCAAAQQALAANLAAARAGSVINWSSPSGHQGEYQITSEPFPAHGSSDCRQAMSVPAPGAGSPQPLVACRSVSGDYSFYSS